MIKQLKSSNAGTSRVPERLGWAKLNWPKAGWTQTEWTKRIAIAAFLTAASVIAQVDNAVAQTGQPTLSSGEENEMPVSQFNDLNQLASGAAENSMQQVTSVSQLTDVKPTDWAFQALQSLVERYGCIVGYPDKTYRGNRALSRYEFAAGLNACLDKIQDLIAAATADFVKKEDLEVIKKLQEGFAAELAVLRGRVETLEVRTATLENQKFSATTKLGGEVAFSIADAFGGRGDDVETVFTDRVRLQLTTSFSGKDRLYTRLTAGNLGTSFATQLGTQEGRFAYDGNTNNDLSIDRLHYVFPVGKKLTVTAMASLGGHHFYADTFNPGLEAGGGATGALSRFAERNPIYRFGLGGQGIGIRFEPTPFVTLEAGYLARGGNLPDAKAGLFDGNYSALVQLVLKPIKNLKIGFSYLNGYDVSAGRRFNFGGTGTNFANLSDATLPRALRTSPVSSNSYGVQVQYDFSPKFSLRGWFGYTDARLIGIGDADILNYAGALVFPDLLKKGNMGAIIVGAEPYATNLPRGFDAPDSVPIHVEALYKYRLNDNIMVTPGFIWLTSPNQNSDNKDVVIGVVRTTFTF